MPKYEKNHYTPQCYIRKWENEKHQVIAIRRENLSSFKTNSNDILFQKKLYWTPTLNPDNPSKFEPEFFTKIDTKFSLILNKLDNFGLGKIDFLNDEERTFMCNFFLMSCFRTPEGMNKIIKTVQSFPNSKHLKSENKVNEHLVEEFATSFDKPSNFTNFLKEKEWYILRSKEDFICSPNPLFWTGRFSLCEESFIFPISPTKALVSGLIIKKRCNLNINQDDINFYNKTVVSSSSLVVVRSEKQAKDIISQWENFVKIEKMGFKKNEFGWYVK